MRCNEWMHTKFSEKWSMNHAGASRFAPINLVAIDCPNHSNFLYAPGTHPQPRNARSDMSEAVVLMC